MKKERKYGINVVTNEAMTLPVSDHIRLIADIGFDAFFTDWNPKSTELWAETAAKCGLFYQSLHAPFSKVNLLWEEGEDGIAYTNRLINCMQDCARYDIPIMVIHPFIGFHDHTPTQIGLDRFSRIIEAAHTHNVKLAFENVEGEEYLAAIMQAFENDPYVGFCYDSGHEMCYNGCKNQLSLYGNRLLHTHLNDNLGVSGESITWKDDLHLPPSAGKADWKRIISDLDAIGYDDILMCELSRTNKPNRHELDPYIAMSIEDFYTNALQAIQKITQ